MVAARSSASEAGTRLRWLAQRLRLERAASTAALIGDESRGPSAMRPVLMSRSKGGVTRG